ncbi:MAG TPA: hypothetical protein VGJ15_07455, partial [Pirellulales bacterium]
MASVSQRRTTRRQGSFQSQRPVARQRKPRRWIKRAVIGLTLLVVTVLLLPTVIAYTPLRNAPLRLALANTNATVQTGGASLSWFGPIRYSDIEIRDEHGDLILSLGKVETERSLIGLIGNLNDLGTLRVERPQVNLVMRPDGSNIEDLLAKVATKKTIEPKTDAEANSGKPHEPAKLPAMTVEIVDGSLSMNDTAANQQWKLDKFNLHLRTVPESALPVEVTLSSQVPLPGRTAQLTIGSVDADAGGLDHVDAKIDGLPLAMFRAVAERFAPGLQLQGTLSTNLRFDGLAQQPNGPLQVSGTLAVDNLIAAGDPLASDRLALARIELPCKIGYQNRRLEVAQLGINSDVGQLALAGSVVVPEKFDSTTLTQLARSAISVEGQLDLAKLAALLPATLHVRSATQITSGQVRLSAASKPDANGNTWTAQLTASDLTALRDGQKLSLEQPISFQASARDQGGNYSIDQFVCSSSFLALQGGGTLDRFHAQGQCDLDRLMQEVSQFIDFGDAKIAGHGDAQFDWQHNAAGAFQANAQTRLQGLQVVLPGKPVWQEDSIVASAVAGGTVDNLSLNTLGAANLRHIDSAQLTATVDNTAARTHEQIDLRVVPGATNDAASRWPIEAHVQGQLGRWWPRIAGWFKLNGVELGGACDLAAQGAYSKAGVEIQQVTANINSLHAWIANSLYVDEPTVQLTASGAYDFNSRQLVLNRSNLLTSTVSVQTDSATVALPAGKPISMQGNVVYQADLARLVRWISDPRTPPSYAMAGRLVGNVDIAHNGPATNGKMNAEIDNFAMYVFDSAGNGGGGGSGSKKSQNALRPTSTQNPDPVWQEARLTLSAAGGLDSFADGLQLSSLDVASQALALHASGKISALSSQKLLDLAGKIDYDWQTLAPLLKPYVGDKVQIAGRESRNFSIRGPLGGTGTVLASAATVRPATASTTDNSRSDNSQTDKFAWMKNLTADASLGWSQAEIYNIRLGQLDADAHLENGALALKPIDMPIGQNLAAGRLTVAPFLRLSPGPSELELGKGPLLTNVQISESLNNPWIKFLAPILSEPARATGIVSIDLDGARVPLSDPKQADVGGHLTLRSAEITPGPLGRPLVLAAKQIEAIVKRKVPPLDLGRDETSVKVDDQTIDFRVIDGRVYHQGLTMRVGDVVIRTRGWVDMDENVNIVAEIPIKDEWTAQR